MCFYLITSFFVTDALFCVILNMYSPVVKDDTFKRLLVKDVLKTSLPKISNTVTLISSLLVLTIFTNPSAAGLGKR